MKLFTKDIDQKLFDQYMMGNDLENQMVVAKIFNPYGNGVWYLLNSDPSDPDYLWAIVDLLEVEVGSVSREELETLKVPPFRLGLERDLYFTPMNAKKLYEALLSGEKFEDGGTIDIIKDKSGESWVFPNNPQGETYGIKLAAGGMTAGRYYKDNTGQELRYIGESQGKLLFKDGEKVVYKQESDFEDAPEEKRIFSFFKDGGKTQSKRYKVNVYYGGEMEDEEFYTDSLDEAERASQGGEHSEIYDNHKKEFVEIEYAKGGKTAIIDEVSSMSFRNQYDDYEMVVISKELEKDGGKLVKDRFMVSAKDIEEAKKIATDLWKEQYGQSDLSIVKVVSDEAYRHNYMGKMAKGGNTESYEVELSAESNPDYDKSSYEGSVDIKSHKVKAKSIENAREIVVAFIMENDLGSGNWSGGNVYKNGKKIGHVSYNGRYWDDTKMAKGGSTSRTVNLTLSDKDSYDYTYTQDGTTASITFGFGKEPFQYEVKKISKSLEPFKQDILDAFTIQGIKQHEYKGGFSEAIKHLDTKVVYEDKMAKGGGVGFEPYGETKGIFKVYYKADGKPQTEIWETKEMAVNTAKRYLSPQMQGEFTNVKVFDEDGSEVDYMSEAKYAHGGAIEPKLVKFNSMYDGMVDAYESVQEKGTYFYVGGDKGQYVVTVESEGFPATEASDDWMYDYEDALDIAKKLAMGEDFYEYAKGGETATKKLLVLKADDEKGGNVFVSKEVVEVKDLNDAKSKVKDFVSQYNLNDKTFTGGEYFKMVKTSKKSGNVTSTEVKSKTLGNIDYNGDFKPTNSSKMAKGGIVKKSKIIENALKDGYFGIQKGSQDFKFKKSFGHEFDYDYLKRVVYNTIAHYFNNDDFYFNWLSDDRQRKEYSIFISELWKKHIDDIDGTLNKYFVLKNTPSSYNDKLYVYNGTFNLPTEIEKSKSLSQDVKTEFQEYRFKQGGEKLFPKKYNYLGKWPNNKVTLKMESGGKMAMGGTTKFKDKVQSIKASLLKRKKVSPKVQKDYGKTYSPKEAEESAKRIVGSMVKKEKRQPRVSKMLEKMKKGTQLNKKKSTFKDRMKELSTKIKERKSKSTK